jgi:hypothetical protein
VFSLIRFSAPRHAVRRERRGVVHHPATKVVAAPLVTATAVVAVDSVNMSSSPQTHLSDVGTSEPTTPQPHQAVRSFPPVTQAAVLAPITTIAVPATTTSTTSTTTHLLPAHAAGPEALARRSAPASRTVSKTPAKTPAKAAIPAGAAMSQPRSAKTIPLGVYAGSGEPSALARFASITGTHPVLASDYLLQSSGWSGMDGAGGSEDWMLDQWRNTGYRLVLGVPILPGGSGGTLAEGASGAYNQYFTLLAQTLVNDGAANAVLRLGWEFNGTWYPWSVANNTDALNYASFWRQIVDTMRAVPGQQFQFVWNPNAGGSSSWNLASAYPGSAYVDYIGTDVYDEYWGTPFTPQASWTNALNQTWGLNWLATFAAAQGKAIALPEWADDFRTDGYGLGDDPNFINQFASWITANDVGFTCIFSYNDTAVGQDNDITNGDFPNALAAFRADFG